MTHRKHKHYDLQQKFYGEFGRWRCIHIHEDGTRSEKYNPLWSEALTYELEEIRPMYQLNGVQYPAPETEPLEMGQIYFIADPSLRVMYNSFTWKNNEYDFICLKRGLVQLETDGAIQHTTAMLAGRPVEVGV